MRKTKTAAVLAAALACALLCGCGGDTVVTGGGSKGMNDWTRGKVTASYTLEELYELPKEELEALEEKYISVTFTVESKDLTDEFTYNITFISGYYAINYYHKVELKTFMFREYWNIPCKEGDLVVAEGYCSDLDLTIDDANKIIYIDISPADVRLKTPKAA